MLKMRRINSVLLSIFIILSSLILPTCISTANAANQTILVEGETPYSTNFKIDTTHAKDTALSGGDFLCLKGGAGVAPPAEGYLVSYKVTVPESGFYQMDITSLPYNSFGSPYDIKVNEGDFVRIDATNGKQYGVVDSVTYKNTFYKYHFISVPMNQGENTVTFRITQARQTDNRIFFYLDCFSFQKVPWGVRSIAFNAPLGVYQEHIDIKPVIKFDTKDLKDNKISYRVIDFWSTEVANGTFTVPKGQDQIELNLGQLQKGHYTLSISVTGSDIIKTDSFSVVQPQNERPSVSDSPFGMDTALSWLTPLDKINDYAEAISLAGIKWVRERFRWSTSNPAPGTYDYNNGNYDTYYNALANKGINILSMFSTSPAWTHTNSTDKLSGDLIAAYTFGRESANHYGGVVPAWEMWNEPELSSTNDNETADRMAAYIKAISIGYKDAQNSPLVSIPGLAYPPANYADLLLQNQIMDYVDIYNFHDHVNYNETDPVLKIPETFKLNLNLLNRYNALDKKVWLTEAGTYIPFGKDANNTALTELTHGQQVRQADYLVTSTVTSLSNGVDKHFWFVLPYYVEAGRAMGIFSQAHTPYAAYSAQAAMTEALGEGKYKGKMNSLPAATTGQIFKDGTDSVAVFWSETPVDITLSLPQRTAVITNIMGGKNTVYSVNGEYKIHIGPEPQYFRIAGDFPDSMVNVQASNKQNTTTTTLTLTPAQRVVLEQKYPADVSVKSKIEGYKLPKNGATAITVEVNNLNSISMTGTIQGTTFGGWELEQQSQSVTVQPYQKASLTFIIKDRPVVKTDTNSAVKFTGDFGGQKTSDSIAIISLAGQEAVTVSNLIPGSDDPSKWTFNISTGGTQSVTAGQEAGSVRFAYTLPDGSKWAFPKLIMPQGTDFNGSKGIAFYANPDSDFTGGTNIKVIVFEKNGCQYYTATGFTLTQGYKQIVIPWSQLAPQSGILDDNFHLDLDQISAISIGMNTSMNNPPAYTVKDFGVYYGNESSMYSTINSITAENGKINVGLAKEMIGINPDTIHLRVDGNSIDCSYDATNGIITGNPGLLQEGSHNVSVQFLYQDGKGEYKNSSVTVDNTPPVTTALIEGTQNNGCYTADVNISLNAADNLSGVDKIEYRTGESGDWVTYTAPVTITQDGIYTIQYRSTDKAGNAEEIKQEIVKIDKTASVATAIVNGTVHSDGTYNSHVSVTLASADAAGGSGVAGIQYSLDGTNWLTYTAPLELRDNGTYSISYKSADNAGNTEDVKNVSVVISMNPDVMVTYVKETVNAMSVADGIKNSLTSKLDNTLSSIMRGNKNSSTNQLNAFANEVDAQRGKKLTAEQADELKAEVSKIIAVINQATVFGIPGI